MVYMGQVLTTGAGQNPARQAAIYAGISKEKTATTINQVCGSGLASIALAFNSIKCEDGDVIIDENESSLLLSETATYSVEIEYATGKMQDSMVVDGLWDIYNQYHMGITAENVAEKFKISRERVRQICLSLSEKSSRSYCC